MKSKTKKWGRLLNGNILGVVDSYGAVHSVFTGCRIDMHGDHFAATHCQWRWNDDQSIHWWVMDHKPNPEQLEAIRSHMTRQYGILWWENGHHDIDHLQEMVRRESEK